MAERHIQVGRPSGETFTEDTLFKVYDSLRAAGLDEQKARETISDMQNKGILFRERTPEPTISVPVCR